MKEVSWLVVPQRRDLCIELLVCELQGDDLIVLLLESLLQLIDRL